MRGLQIVFLLLSLSLLIFIGIFVLHGFSENSLRLNIRASARISFFIFCMAFSASSLQYFIKGQFTFWLLMNRKFFGITFAIIHLIHLCFLVILQLQFHPLFELADMTSLLGGGGAYVFVVLMLITSFEVVKSRISNQVWKIIHTIGGYWIAAVFLTSYGKRALIQWEYIPLLILLIVVLVLKSLKAFRIKG